MLGLLGGLAGLILGSSLRVPLSVLGRISDRSLCLCPLNFEWLSKDSRVLLRGALLHLLLQHVDCVGTLGLTSGGGRRVMIVVQSPHTSVLLLRRLLLHHAFGGHDEALES